MRSPRIDPRPVRLSFGPVAIEASSLRKRGVPPSRRVRSHRGMMGASERTNGLKWADEAHTGREQRWIFTIRLEPAEAEYSDPPRVRRGPDSLGG